MLPSPLQSTVDFFIGNSQSCNASPLADEIERSGLQAPGELESVDHDPRTTHIRAIPVLPAHLQLVAVVTLIRFSVADSRHWWNWGPIFAYRAEHTQVSQISASHNEKPWYRRDARQAPLKVFCRSALASHWKCVKKFIMHTRVSDGLPYPRQN